MTDQQKNSRGNLPFLDGLRGLAAFYVVVGHARWLLWEGYGEGYLLHAGSYSKINKVLMYFFSLFKYGHEAVLFFFVLSGFVIHLRYAQRLLDEGAKSRFDWSNFIKRRARRLYPPLLAAMVLSLILGLIGKSQGFTIYQQATPYALINENVICHLDVVTWIGNLAYLMDTYVPVYGANGPLWSLKFEWWFYMIYPAFWWISRRSILWATVGMTALYVASFFPALWPVRLLHEIFSSMLAWWLGVLLADVFVGRIKCRWSFIVIGATLLGVLMMRGPVHCHDMGVGLLFAALLAFCFSLHDRDVRLSVLERLKPLGDMSYTLYVTHFPVLVLISGWLMGRTSNGVLPQHFGWVFLGIGITMIIAYALYLIVERPSISRKPRLVSSPIHAP